MLQDMAVKRRMAAEVRHTAHGASGHVPLGFLMLMSVYPALIPSLLGATPQVDFAKKRLAAAHRAAKASGSGKAATQSTQVSGTAASARLICLH